MRERKNKRQEVLHSSENHPHTPTRIIVNIYFRRKKNYDPSAGLTDGGYFSCYVLKKKELSEKKIRVAKTSKKVFDYLVLSLFFSRDGLFKLFQKHGVVHMQ